MPLLNSGIIFLAALTVCLAVFPDDAQIIINVVAIPFLLCSLLGILNLEFALISVLALPLYNSSNAIHLMSNFLGNSGFPWFAHATGYARWIPLLFLGGRALYDGVFRKGGFHIRKPDIVAACFLATAGLSVFYSLAPELTAQRTIAIGLGYVGVFWALWDYVDTPRKAERLVEIILFVGLTIFVVGLAKDLAEGAVPFVDLFSGIERSRDFNGFYAPLLSPLAVWVFMRKSRIIGGIALAILIASLLLSGYRTGVIMLALPVAYLVVRRWQELWWTAIPVGLTAAFAVIAITSCEGNYLFSLPEDFVEADWITVTDGDGKPMQYGVEFMVTVGDRKLVLTTCSQEYATFGLRNIISMSGRTEGLQIGYSLLRDRYLLGYGFGTENLIMPAHAIYPTLMSGVYFHNSFLGLALQLGLFGALIFFGPLFYLLVKQLVSHRGRSTPLLIHALEAVLISGLFGCLFQSWIYALGNGIALPFWVIVMLIIRHNHYVATDSRVNLT